MSCSFWNMRRRLRAQQQKDDSVIVDIATAQAEEKAAVSEAEEKAVTENANKRTGRKPKVGNSSD